MSRIEPFLASVTKLVAEMGGRKTLSKSERQKAITAYMDGERTDLLVM